MVAAPVNLEDVQNQLEDVDPVHLVVEGKLETSNEEDMHGTEEEMVTNHIPLHRLNKVR